MVDARGAGVPVVLLHGARASRTMWRAQVVALEAAGHLALSIDLPGHGIRVGERFSLEASDEVIGAAVGSVGGRAMVVGLSLGGYLGIAHAARHPEQVAGLVAAGCSTAPDQPVTSAWLQVARVIARLPDHGARLNQTLVDRTVPPEAVAALEEGGFALDVMVDLLSQMRTENTVDALARIACPVWLVNGQWDHFRTQERSFLRACPTARLVTVRGATHLVNLVRPVAFTRGLLEALDEVDAVERGRASAGAPPQGRRAPGQAQPGGVRNDQARTPPTMPAEFGTTTTSSPSAARTGGRMQRAFPPPR